MEKCEEDDVKESGEDNVQKSEEDNVKESEEDGLDKDAAVHPSMSAV